MSDYPMYNGAGLSLQAPMGQMAGREIGAGVLPALEAANNSRAVMAGKANDDLNKMRDYKAGAQGERDLDNVRADYERRLQEGLTAAPGSAKSFFFEDGTEDEDKTAAFYSEMGDAFAAIEPEFINSEAGARWRENKAGYMQNERNRLQGQIHQHELQSIRQSFEERHALALAQGDIGAALRNIDNAVGSGIITEVKAQTMRLSLAKRSARSAGAAGGGGEYSSALLDSLVEEDSDGEDVSTADGGEVAGDSVSSLTEEDVSVSLGDVARIAGNRTVLRSLTPDEWEEDFSDAMGKAGRSELIVKPENGAVEWKTTPCTNDHIQSMAAKARETHVVPPMDEYRRGVNAVCAQYIGDPQYAGLTKEQALKVVKNDCMVDGLAEVYFPDAENPEAAYESMVQEEFNRYWDTRSAGIEERVNHAMKTREGLPGIDGQVSKAMNNGVSLRYIVANLVKGALYSDSDSDWEEYQEYARNYLRLVAVDAVVDYRQGGGADWAEEQAVIGRALEQGVKSLDFTGTEIQTWKKKKQKDMVARSREAAIEAKSFKERMAPLKADARERKEEAAAAKKEQERQQKLAEERIKWEDEEAAAARKKEWKAERAKEQQRQNPYTGKVAVSVRYADDGREEPSLTVPMAEYEKIRTQLGAGNEDGIAVTFAGSSKALIVRGGSVNGATFNKAAFMHLYGQKKRMKRDETSRLVNKRVQEMRFHIATPEVF